VRLSIERIRTLVLAAGVLLVAVLAVFLAVGKWRAPFGRRDIPKRLGIDIQEEANGVTYTQSHGGNTIFKIHASKVVQLKNDRATLHDVLIELYGKNDGRVDRIKGDEFEYDQKAEIATAAGPVEITLMRPSVQPSAFRSGTKPSVLAASDEIHVETSGLVFNQQTGIASTDQRVNFTSAQGSGSAIGASYDSDRGLLVLDRAVELTTRRGGYPVEVRADHAEFDRNAQVSRLRDVLTQRRDEQATAAEAQIAFRDDGSVERLDASGGLTVLTATGSRIAAPRGSMQFNEDNQPQRGRLEGGVTLTSVSGGRTLSGGSPTMDLAFNTAGELRHAHLERGVEIESHEQGQSIASGHAVSIETSRTWHSPVADVDFRSAGEGRVEPAAMHGSGGVVVTGETRRGDAAPSPSRLSADEVTGVFGPHSTLTTMTGTGHASLEEATANGAHDTTFGDRLQASFAPSGTIPVLPRGERGRGKPGRQATANLPAESAPQITQIQSAVLDGNVTLVQQPATKPGAKPEPPLRATAGRAVYESAGQWLHLSMNPRVNDGGMELTADCLDVSQESGDAFAHGNVKATWLDTAASDGPNAADLGGNGPAHVVAAEALLHQSSGEATFRGRARLWQQDNSISAPLIVVDRQKQALSAKTANRAEPVVAVLLNASAQTANAQSKRSDRAATSSVVRVRGGDLWYSEAERRAVMLAAPLPAVTAQGSGVESASDQVELYLAPRGLAQQSATGTAPAEVERMNAIGHVVLTSQNRRGLGEKLTYTSQSGEYVLTGTASTPPRLTDPRRGNVTCAALIFNSRNDSVSIEGGGHQTTTETTAPR